MYGYVWATLGNHTSNRKGDLMAKNLCSQCSITQTFPKHNEIARTTTATTRICQLNNTYKYWHNWHTQHITDTWDPYGTHNQKPSHPFWSTAMAPDVFPWIASRPKRAAAEKMPHPEGPAHCPKIVGPIIVHQGSWSMKNLASQHADAYGIISNVKAKKQGVLPGEVRFHCASAVFDVFWHVRRAAYRLTNM